MSVTTRTQAHGPNAEYHRIGIPNEVSKELGIKKGDTWLWNILDDHSVTLRLIK